MTKFKSIFDFEIPYWKGKRMEFTLDKIIGEKSYIYRLGIWKLHRMEYYHNEWGTNWWKFYDIWKGNYNGRKKGLL